MISCFYNALDTYSLRPILMVWKWPELLGGK